MSTCTFIRHPGTFHKTGKSLPFISPLLLTMTPALSSKYINTPFFLRTGFLCRITTAGITVNQKNCDILYNWIKILHIQMHLKHIAYYQTEEKRLMQVSYIFQDFSLYT